MRPSRGRPRDPRKEAAILDAALALLAEAGYEGVSMEGVAARAGTSKATVYRRWATRRDLVVAAVRAQQGEPLAEVDTGSLRGDLLALCGRLVAMLGRSPGSLVVALLSGAAQDPALGDLLEETAGHTGARLPPQVLRRAVDRGELPTGARAYPFDEVAGSVLVLRALTGAPVDDAHLEHLVDTVLLPALERSARTPAPPSPAVFAAGPVSGPAAHPHLPTAD